MDILVQRKWLMRLVIVLALMNLTLLGVFGWRMLHKGRKQTKARQESSRQLSGLLRDELGLSAAQEDSLHLIRQSFFEKEKILSAATRSKRDSMNQLMFSASNQDTVLQQLAAGVAENEFLMEMLRIEQAAKLRAICNPQQLKKLEGLVREIRDYLKPEAKPAKKEN